MRNPKASIALFAVLLTACSAAGPRAGEDLQDKLSNPLYAERYYDELVDLMVNLEIQNDPLTDDESTKAIIDKNRVEGLKLAREANQKQNEGLSGMIVSDGEYAFGEALLLNDTLFLSPTFETVPGPDLHVYLTKIVDPRDGTFPDETAVELGTLKDAYGEQRYSAPVNPEGIEEGYRTFVLWDVQMKRVFGFAQLQTR